MQNEPTNIRKNQDSVPALFIPEDPMTYEQGRAWVAQNMPGGHKAHIITFRGQVIDIRISPPFGELIICQ